MFYQSPKNVDVSKALTEAVCALNNITPAKMYEEREVEKQRFHVERGMFNGNREFALYASMLGKHDREYMLRLVMEDVDGNYRPDKQPALRATKEELTQLMTELWREGIRPENYNDDVAALEETRTTVNDLKRMAEDAKDSLKSVSLVLGAVSKG